MFAKFFLFTKKEVPTSILHCSRGKILNYKRGSTFLQEKKKRKHTTQLKHTNTHTHKTNRVPPATQYIFRCQLFVKKPLKFSPIRFGKPFVCWARGPPRQPFTKWPTKSLMQMNYLNQGECNTTIYVQFSSLFYC